MGFAQQCFYSWFKLNTLFYRCISLGYLVWFLLPSLFRVLQKRDLWGSYQFMSPFLTKATAMCEGSYVLNLIGMERFLLLRKKQKY